jgi:cell division protein FtsL
MTEVDNQDKYEELNTNDKKGDLSNKKGKKKLFKKIAYAIVLIIIIVAGFVIYKKTKEINDLRKEIEDEKLRREEEKNILVDSKIIAGNIEEKETLRKWINSEVSFQTKLLYRLSRDGASIFNFHSKCDYTAPTLLIIESYDDNKFGGYTTGSWDMFGSIYKNASKTFLYSLTKNKKYVKKPNAPANGDIFSGSRDVGPWFGIHDLYFYGTMNDLYTYKYSGQCAFLDGNGLVDKTSIDNSVVVKEIEMYQIIFKQ